MLTLAGISKLFLSLGGILGCAKGLELMIEWGFKKTSTGGSKQKLRLEEGED